LPEAAIGRRVSWGREERFGEQFDAPGAGGPGHAPQAGTARRSIPKLEFTVSRQVRPASATPARATALPARGRSRSPRGRRLGSINRLLVLLVLLEAVALVVVIGSKGQRPASIATPRATRVATHTARRHRADRAPSPTKSPPYPAIGAMSAASSYIEARAGTNAFAVVDSRGKEFGLNDHRLYLSASTMKSMLLVAYLRNLAAQHGTVGAQSASLLQPMIHVSDNNAAEAVWDIVGTSGLESIAHLSGMTDFAAGRDWANELISCADMARFFYKMDSLIPRQFRSYARALLSGVEPTESWGIPQVARPRWRVYFKGGWRGTAEGQLVSQIGRLEQRGRKIAIAMMTVGDPSMYYGEETIAGVTARLLAGSKPGA
jgi:hypothetical protein